MSAPIIEMLPMARTIVERILSIKPGEKVCIYTDTQRPESITQLLAGSVRAAGAEPVVVTITPREVGGVDPPPVAIAAIQAADVIIAQASYAIIHTETVRNALKQGSRICEMWGFNEDMMVHGGATADYPAIRELSLKLEKILTEGKEARLTTPDGTDMTVSMEGRGGAILAGFATGPGQFCAFPDGEATIAPIEGSARGVLVNPFCMEKQEFGFIKEGITLKVEGGRVVAIEGGLIASQLRSLLDSMGDTARNIAELAIGTNPKARVGVTIRETKKAWGTTHVALGDSRSIGGTVESPLHMDMIFREPTLVVDGKTIVKDGQILIR
ncbi:MAG: aminopeptidase [Dehalococcoidales bacterium]|nr:aminopeptidase [Dehalococcoidales bacterium]MDZ4230577.1 aminopeptidase [Dehalococcoidales bacterium]